MNNSRIWTEFFDVIGHTVIKTCTNCQNNISMMHAHVGFISAMHAEHTQELTIRARERTQDPLKYWSLVSLDDEQGRSTLYGHYSKSHHHQHITGRCAANKVSTAFLI